MTTPLLTARGIVKSYGQIPALRGVNVDVSEGEIVAITGPSGCGKSTLLHCLAGILQPDAGEVTYGGERIDIWSEGARSHLRRTEFGVLFQFGHLVPELTAAENVALPLLLGGTGRKPARTAAIWRTPYLASCPVASSNGRPWPGHWLPSPESCSPTSPPAPWTPWPESRCSIT